MGVAQAKARACICNGEPRKEAYCGVFLTVQIGRQDHRKRMAFRVEFPQFLRESTRFDAEQLAAKEICPFII